MDAEAKWKRDVSIGRIIHPRDICRSIISEPNFTTLSKFLRGGIVRWGSTFPAKTATAPAYGNHLRKMLHPGSGRLLPLA